MPDWATVHRELRRASVTLQLLWMEHKESHPEGHQYTQFVHHYREWARHLDVVLRHEHHAGDKLFLDFAGETIPVVDPETGAEDPWELFVGVLGASSFTYAEALPSQQLQQWVAAHVHCFEYLGGCPRILVPDNLKSAVVKAHRYEPLLNRIYEDLAAHYGCAVIPARPHRPRDKAKVESGVLMAERWILASLRHRTFFSGADLNLAIRERLEWLNNRPFKKLDGSRRSLFEEIDKPALRPLPERPFEYGIWKKGKVNIDYHIEVDHHLYSVPYQLVSQPYEARLTASTVEVFARGRRIASHPRSFKRGGFTTLPEHMPDSHRRHLEWNSEPDHAMGGGDRATDSGAGRRHPPFPAPSRAGLPGLPWGAAPGQALRPGAAGGGLHPRRLHRRLQLSQRRVDPVHRPRPPAAPAPERQRSRPAPQRPRTQLLPVTRRFPPCSSPRPWTSSTPST